MARRILASLLLVLACACSAPRYDPSTLEGKAAILDQVNRALNTGDCASAIAAIEEVYNSPHVDNNVRLARAAAHACALGINFFDMVTKLTQANLTPPGLWASLPQIFAETDATKLNKRIQSGWFAADGLMSALMPGAVVITNAQIDLGDYNTGSGMADDRVPDANSYLIFASMASIGAIHNRYGAPDATTYAKTTNLGATDLVGVGWGIHTAINSNTDATPCSYAASLLNMVDGIGALSGQVDGQLATSLATVQTLLGTAFGAACNAGCKSTAPAGVLPAAAGGDIDFSGMCGFTDDNCAGTAALPCPIELRNRTKCTGVVSNRASCAAAGLIRFMNLGTLGWN